MYIIYVIVCAHVYQNISFGKIPVDFYFAFSPLSIFSLFFCNKFILFLQKKKYPPSLNSLATLEKAIQHSLDFMIDK